MFFTDPVFVGVESASSHRSFVYAVLDRSLNLVALADGELNDVTTFLAGVTSAVVAINSPSSVSRGVAAGKKKELFKSPRSRASSFRAAELELRSRGIAVSGTPSVAANCPAWVQAGFSLYRKLEKDGFKKYPAEGHPRQLLETHPHAAFYVMSGGAPQPKNTLEGKIQRQLMLFEAGVRIKDPMDFFEEITRHKMIKGVWPFDLLYLPEQLDALVAAYTAWLAFHKPEKISTVGDPREGLIVLPG